MFWDIENARPFLTFIFFKRESIEQSIFLGSLIQFCISSSVRKKFFIEFITTLIERTILGEEGAEDVAVDVGEAKVAALVAIG